MCTTTYLPMYQIFPRSFAHRATSSKIALFDTIWYGTISRISLDNVVPPLCVGFGWLATSCTESWSAVTTSTNGDFTPGADTRPSHVNDLDRGRLKIGLWLAGMRWYDVLSTCSNFFITGPTLGFCCCHYVRFESALLFLNTYWIGCLYCCLSWIWYDGFRMDWIVHDWIERF